MSTANVPLLAPPQRTSGTTVAPPLGTGSLQLLTGDGPRDKVAFGNEVDFVGKALSSVNAIGFAVYQTGEDTKADRNGGTMNPDNLPNISLEVDPAVAGKTYSSLVFVPKGSAANVNKWRTYDAAAANTADGGWYFSNGDVAAATGCTQANYCTWAQVKTGAPNATLLTVQVGKGVDREFQGAVDALRIGGTVYDFEARGVFARNA